MSEAIAAKIEAQTRELKDGSGGNPQAIPLNLNDSPEAQPTSPTAEVVDQTVIDHEQLDLSETQQRQAVVEETFTQARKLTEAIIEQAEARIRETAARANDSFKYARDLADQVSQELMGFNDVNWVHDLYRNAVETISPAGDRFNQVKIEIKRRVSKKIEDAEAIAETSKAKEIEEADNQPFTFSLDDGPQVAIDKLCDWSINLAERVKSGANGLANDLLQMVAVDLANECRIQVQQSLNWALEDNRGAAIRHKAEEEVATINATFDPQKCFNNSMSDVLPLLENFHNKLVADAEKQRNLSLQQIAETDSQPEVTQPPQAADSFESHQQRYQKEVEKIHDDYAARLAEKITTNQAAVTEASQALETAHSVAHQVAEQAAIAAQTPEEVRLAYVDQLAPIEQAYMQSLANLSAATRAKFAFEKDNSLDEQGQAALEQAIQTHPAVVAHRSPQPTGGVV